MLTVAPDAGFHFLRNTQPIAVPFSAAVVAETGYEIVRAILERPLPYRQGFQLIEKHLATLDRPRHALCSVELRCAAPYTLEGFNAFNAGYADLLQEWGLLLDGVGVATRTNIAPVVNPPTEQVLYAFAYAVPASPAATTYVLSGAFERPGLRSGETAPDALREKTADVMDTLDERMQAAGVRWDAATEIGLYTDHDLGDALRSEVLPRIGMAAAHGIHWYPSRVPVAGYELEIDVRAINREHRIAAYRYAVDHHMNERLQ